MTFASPDALKPPAADRALLFWLAGSAGLWLVYSLVFVGTSQASLGRAMAAALANVLPLVLLMIGVQRLLRRRVLGRSVSVQVLAHCGLAAAFAIAWYGAIVLLLAVFGQIAGRGLHLAGFSGPALTWQVFQGLILYGFAAAACYAMARPETAASVLASDPSRPLERYLIREGEDFRPVEVRDIVTIAGAQDYSEVSTPSGRHLVRMSLGEFESRLDPARFIRVHRSAIIHLAHLERAELAGGGRMLAHMADGQAIPVSRSGVKALRSLVV